MSKLYGLLVGLLFLGLSVSAQTRVVAGKVIDSRDGSGLTGVTVAVKNGTVNTQTTTDGTFSITVPQSATVLVFSYVGYQTVEQAISNDMTVSLQTAEKALNEVIVVGYGTRTRRDVTGSVAKVSAREIANTPATSFENAIQGRAAGVFVEQENGKVGQGIKMRIRGASSVTAGNEPLYIIDGIPVINANLSTNGARTNPMADINMNDIESIEILKDASAAAIYGSRASNGVVLITTKRGRAGKSKIEVGFFTGWQSPTRKRKFMNAEQYVNFFLDAAERGARYEFKLYEDYYNSIGVTLEDNIADFISITEGRFNRYSAGNEDWRTYKTNTNWEDQAFQDAPITQGDINISGGNDKTTFYIGGQVLDQKGIMIANSFKRYSARLNLDHKVREYLNIGMNLSFMRSLNQRISNDNAFSNPLQAVALSPITPVIDPRTGLLSGELDPVTGRPNTNYPVYYNPLLNAKGVDYNTVVYRTIGNVYGDLKLAKGLSFRSEFGVDQLNSTEEGYYSPITVRNVGAPQGLGFYTADGILNLNTNNFFRYATTVSDDHSIDATLGTSFQDQKWSNAYLEAEQFPSVAYRKLESASSKTDASTSETRFTMLSYFARANYKFKDRYLLSLSGRYDGSSRFGINNRWGFFPAASAGWIISEEDFFQSNLVSFLKLKASYGLTGNAEIGNFASLGLWTGDAAYGGVPGQAPTQLSNPDLKWETSVGFDGGVEVGLWNGRVSVELDYYVRNTRDLLLLVNVPGTSGFASQMRNIGKLNNKGIEVVLNTENINTKDFRWTSNFNFSANRNKITDLDGQELGTGNYNRAREGYAIGVFVAREFAGADPNNGDALYYKNTLKSDGSRDRTTTNDYNEAEEVVIGNPNPDFIYGFRNVFTFSGIEVDVLLQGVYGNDIYDGGGQYYSSAGSNGYDNQTLDQLNAWKQPGDKTMVPEARLFYANGTDPSSRYILDGSYMRVKSLSVAYTIPTAITTRWGLDRLRIYAKAQNLFTFTDYKGWDPEVNADYQAGNINQGVDFYSAPQIKSIVFGVNIGL